MKHYKTVEETVEKMRVDKRVCDVCGLEVTKSPSSWGAKVSEVAETTVKMRTGTQYPEGGWGTKVELDICPDCFEKRLIPWVEEQGGTVEKQEWEY